MAENIRKTLTVTESRSPLLRDFLEAHSDRIGVQLLIGALEEVLKRYGEAGLRALAAGLPVSSDAQGFVAREVRSPGEREQAARAEWLVQVDPPVAVSVVEPVVGGNLPQNPSFSGDSKNVSEDQKAPTIRNEEHIEKAPLTEYAGEPSITVGREETVNKVEPVLSSFEEKTSTIANEPNEQTSGNKPVVQREENSNGLSEDDRKRLQRLSSGFVDL